MHASGWERGGSDPDHMRIHMQAYIYIHHACMHQVEKEEERISYSDPDRQCFHLCIINLVIGTLYCAKVCACISMCAYTQHIRMCVLWQGLCVQFYGRLCNYTGIYIMMLYIYIYIYIYIHIYIYMHMNH